MNVKQLILISSLAAIPTLKAENPLEKLQGDLTDEQAFEILEHEDIHEHIDTIEITISINRNKKKEDIAAWKTIIKRAATFAKECRNKDTEQEFFMNEFSELVKETCEDLVESDLHGNAFIKVSNESEENENYVAIGYEKS